jgi:hypothetical protein
MQTKHNKTRELTLKSRNHCFLNQKSLLLTDFNPYAAYSLLIQVLRAQRNPKKLLAGSNSKKVEKTVVYAYIHKKVY